MRHRMVMNVRRNTRTAVITITLVALLALSSTACTPGMFRLVATAAITTAVVAAVIHSHDDHYHHSRCGHEYVFVDGREVYQYQGRWEYYDPSDGQWYVYDDLEVY